MQSHSGRLKDKRIAILVTDGFEKEELTEPLRAISEEGGTADIISLKKGNIFSWYNKSWADPFDVDHTVEEVGAKDFDGLLLPGGVINSDKLRDDADAVNFVKAFFNPEDPKPVAAICHGLWILINAGVVSGRVMTSYSSLKMDLKNAGADWIDREVVVDQRLVTSRGPKDLEVFIPKMIEEFSKT